MNISSAQPTEDWRVVFRRAAAGILAAADACQAGCRIHGTFAVMVPAVQHISNKQHAERKDSGRARRHSTLSKQEVHVIGDCFGGQPAQAPSPWRGGGADVDTDREARTRRKAAPPSTITLSLFLSSSPLLPCIHPFNSSSDTIPQHSQFCNHG